MIKKNKRFNYHPRYNVDKKLYFQQNNKKYKSNFFLFIIIILLLFLAYLILTY